MEARVLTYEIPPAKLADAVRVWEEKVMPTLRGRAGFGGGLLLTNQESGKMLAISMWEADADREAYEASGEFKALLADVEQVIAGPPSIEHYDVSIRH